MAATHAGRAAVFARGRACDGCPLAAQRTKEEPALPAANCSGAAEARRSCVQSAPAWAQVQAAARSSSWR